MVQAREYLTRALEIFEYLGALGEPDKVRQALAELPAGKGWEVERCYAPCVASCT
jgi:hypothetical protein